jgi:hypothetical protein
MAPRIMARIRSLAREAWPGARVAKTAVATAIAWWAASRFGDQAPMFAVFGALNGMQPTVAGSIRRTGGALLGIVLGTLLAIVSDAVVEAPRPIMVALLVGIGLLATLRMNAYGLLGTEVAVTGLLVFALSQGSFVFGLARFGETALGGGVAVVINALVLPPDYRADAREAVERLASIVLVHLGTAFEDLTAPPPKQVAHAHFVGVRAASQLAEEQVSHMRRAREALRYSPFLRYLRRGDPAEVERYARGVEALGAAMAHVQTAARAAWHASRRPTQHRSPVGDWTGLFTDTQIAVERFERYLGTGSADDLELARTALRYALAKQAQVVEATREAMDGWDVDRAAALAEVEHLLDDLRLALRESSAR